MPSLPAPTTPTSARSSPSRVPSFHVPVLPLGNLLPCDALDFHRRRRQGLGLFSCLPDVLILRILDEAASFHDGASAARALSLFSMASTAAFALSSDDDLWRRVAFSLYTPTRLARLRFLSSWRLSTLHALNCSAGTGDEDEDKGNDTGMHHRTEELEDTKTSSLSPSCSTSSSADTNTNTNTNTSTNTNACRYYSDILFHKRRCRLSEIPPEWTLHDDIPRVSGAALSLQDFQQRFEVPRKPVILTDVARSWPASSSWADLDSLCTALGDDVKFNAGGYLFSLGEYVSYARRVASWDDQSVIIFDHSFVEKSVPVSSVLSSGYSIPSIFSDDLFSLLTTHPPADAQRPDFRWLIVGPSRSGSSFHKDPNATSAWNAALTGRKKWIFFPPHVTPPGVTPTSDEALVSTPVSIMEWFINFYDRDVITSSGGMEATVSPGEIMFVPRGWWHCVLNLDMTVAVTQNFVSSASADRVVHWLRTHGDQISGCRSDKLKRFLAGSAFPTLIVDRFPHLRQRLAFALGGDKRQDQQQREIDDEENSGPERNVNTKDMDKCAKDRKRKSPGATTSSLWQSLRTSSSTCSASHAEDDDTSAGRSEQKNSTEDATMAHQSQPTKQFRFSFQLGD